MLSQLPLNFAKQDQNGIDRQILRLGIIAELDAVSLYEQLAGMTNDPSLKAILMDIAKEEKTHVGEFQALLLKKDSQQQEELARGQKEVNEINSD